MGSSPTDLIHGTVDQRQSQKTQNLQSVGSNPTRAIMEPKTKTLFIDPPTGWLYGFPKEAPVNLRQMDADQFHEWLISNGYPQEQVDYWKNSPKYNSVPCRFFEA